MKKIKKLKKLAFLEYRTEILTGVRPTSDLTIANYLGAIAPIIDLQNKGHSPLVFVADLHAVTDKEPTQIKKYIYSIVADYIALGIDSKKTKIYIQSYIGKEIGFLTAILARLISVSELLRIPTLKEKIKKNASPESVNVLLLLYPIMMASDILINKARLVPVGEDQLPHIEITRELARKFNKKYGDIFPMPRALLLKPLRILSLKGEGKMSKTKPEGAIFLTDDIKTIEKIKSAETAFEGVINENLNSLISIAKGLAKNKDDVNEIKKIIEEHKKGKKVMSQFKNKLIEIVQNFLKDFQIKRNEIVKNISYIKNIIEEGNKIAKENAIQTLNEVEKIFWDKS